MKALTSRFSKISESTTDRIVSVLFRDSFIIMLILIIVGSIASTVDSAVAGNYLNAAAISAIGITYPFTKLMECISKTFSAGVQIVCSKQLGMKKMDEVNSTFTIVSVTLLLISLAVSVITIALKGPLSVLFGAREAAGTLSFTSDYLFAIALGVPGNLGTLFLIPVLQMDGDKKRVNIASVVMMAVNVIFSVLSVIVWGMGIKGIGYATSLSYYASFIVLFSHFFSSKCRFRFSLKNIQFRFLKQVVANGSVAASSNFLSAINNVVISNIVAGFADVNAMAAFSLYKATKHFFLAFSEASGDAVRLLTGMFLAENDRRGLKQLFKSSVKTSLLFSSIITAGILIFAGPIYSLFVSGAALHETVVFMRLYTITIMIDVLMNFYLSYFQCIKKQRYVLIINTMQNIAGMAISFLCALLWGSTGIWISLSGLRVISLILTCIFVNRENQKFSWSLDYLLMLKSENSGTVIDRTIRNHEDLKELLNDAESIHSECADILKVIAEDIMKNFNANDNSMDIMVSVNSDSAVTIRFRDNCKVSISGNTKIYSVNGKEVTGKYVNAFGLNNLTVKIR